MTCDEVRTLDKETPRKNQLDTCLCPMPDTASIHSATLAIKDRFALPVEPTMIRLAGACPRFPPLP